MVRGAFRPPVVHKAHLVPHWRGRGEKETWLLAALLVVALRHIAMQGRGLIKHGHRSGVMKRSINRTPSVKIGDLIDSFFICKNRVNQFDIVANP
jgi:hypothetical protein